MLKDVKACFVAIKQVNRTRKAGYKADIGVKRAIPVIKQSNWGWTMECGIFGNTSQEIARSAKAVFLTFDEETQRALTFSPKPGEWVNRAKLWRGALKPVLPPAQYIVAMTELLSWYIHCIGEGRVGV